VRQHVGGGSGVFDPKMDKMMWEIMYLNDHEVEIDQLVVDILDAKKATPVIVAMEQDLEDERNTNEYHLYLAFPPSTENLEDVSTPAKPGLFRRVRVPLVAFCEKLAKAFEGQMTSTTLCFVADASCGLGSEILTNVVKDCGHGVATISNPCWMTALSLLLSKKHTCSITPEQFERIAFSLCRLEAHRVRSSIGKTSRTVVFTLPGQACTPLLLPLVQKVFVHERHVFVYDGCCHSVEMGLALRKKYGSSYRQKPEKEEWECVSATPQVISATFPMAPLKHNKELTETLSKLKGDQASIVEAWMASVDTFLDMKAKEKKNFYTPFVCRMGFLMARSGIGNGDGTDKSGLALKNVLQYITGSRSRALSEEVINKALKSLKENRIKSEEAVKEFKLDNPGKILIEKCVFAHKGILIGEKTLIDTVQPKDDWSLKAAKKLKSCLCCAPGEEDEEDEDEENEAGGEKDGDKGKDEVDMSVPGAFASNTGRSKYVDGKAAFAFDPAQFSK